MAFKLDQAPKKVYLAPEQIPVPFEYAAGRANISVPVIHGHAMVVFE